MSRHDFLCPKCDYELFDVYVKIGEDAKIPCPKCDTVLEKQFPTKIAVHYKGTGWHNTDYKTKGKKFTKESVKKLDKEQKLALAVKSIEHQTGRDFLEIVDSCKDDKIKATNKNGKVTTKVEND